MIEQFKKWQNRYSQWWLNRELSPLIQQGVGYHQFQFPAGELSDEEAKQRVCEFIKRSVTASRQPYGFSLYLVSISAAPLSAIRPGIFQCPAEDFLPPFDRRSFHSAEIQATISERVHTLNRDVGKEIVVAFNSAGDLITAHYDAKHLASG